MQTLTALYYIAIISIGVGVISTCVYGIWNFIKHMLK